MSAAKARRGAVTVEMAIAAPILFLFVFAALEVAGMNVIRHSVDNAAYEAARRGIVPGATIADINAEANMIMTAAGATNVNVNVVPGVINEDTPEITVTVTVPVDGNSWGWVRFFSRADNIVGECRMAREEL